ncbi:hypothetical protein MKX03_037434 [Papaver bracteatum]|nr:hypothetical protein MKX03_037434 [Papaver bracteatum]
MDAMIMEGSLLREIKKLFITTTTTEKQISLEPHLAFCYSMFMKDIQTIICVLWCVLRALDTVEDDTNIPSELKVPILEDFHRHIYDRDLPISCGTKRHKVLMDEYHHVSSALLDLQKGYHISIENIVKIMGVGMAKYILNEVETVDDYNEYCFKAVGIVFLEMSKHLHASNLEDPTSDNHSLGTMLQKLHIIQDFFDDMNEIPKGRIYWPRQIWSKYVDKLDDLIHPEEPEKALWCLNDMVTDALSHAADSLEYLSTLPHSGTFNLCAIIQVIAVGTLSLCYNNIEVFRGGARMSPGQCAKAVLGIKTMSDVYEAIYDFLSTLKTKIDSNDPNATKTLTCVKEIQKICGNSGLLNQSNSSLDTEVDEKRCQVQQGGNSSMEEQQVDPFSLVADELSLIGNRLREMVVSVEVPKLASAAGYFFEVGVEGKRFRPTILLLMASALNVSVLPGSKPDTVTNFSNELRTRQQRIAEITEMIHVASLLHDDVLDDAETRRGVLSVNFSMGNKLSVLAGDFLLSRACVALTSLNNLEVISLVSEVIEHLVTGETMQMASTLEQRCNMDHYMRKTYYKTASLIANSCRTIAILAGQTSEAEILAYNYGKHLGLAYQLIDDVLDFTGTSTSLGKGSLSDIRHGIITAPILFAIEEIPELQKVIDRGFNDPRDVDISLEYLGKSRGIQRAIELATEHANLAASAINSLPQSGDDKVRISRRALVDLTHIIITRTN